ncbi:MAG: hypothetical protein ACLFQ2_13250 [Wenzhouxiangella sp.]
MTVYRATRPSATDPQAEHHFLVIGKDRRGTTHRRYIRAEKDPLKTAYAAMPPGVISVTLRLVTARDLGMVELPA